MIIIEKSKRLLRCPDKNGEILFSCPVSLGKCPVGAKLCEGDQKTPEGLYRIVSINPQSKFHLAFGISYPERHDARIALREKRISRMTFMRIALSSLLGVRPPWNTALGGFIMLHGESPEGLEGDWTAGCIALKNRDIDLLAKHIKKRERVKILP